MATQDPLDRAEAGDTPSLELQQILNLVRTHSPKARATCAMDFQLVAQGHNPLHERERGHRSETVRPVTAIDQRGPAASLKALQPFRQPSMAPLQTLTDRRERCAALVPFDRQRTQLQLRIAVRHRTLPSWTERYRADRAALVTDVLKAA
jgi:hypothetical protein